MHRNADPAEQAWRIALSRAARDHMKLTLGFDSLSLDEVGLVEVLETPMERAMILILEGAGDALGLMTISSPILSGMIEMLTLSRLGADHDGPPRNPTRTDAAMVVDMIDAALAAFAQTMAEKGAAPWSQPFHYAAFIEDQRPLHLMLEDGSYRLMRAEVHLENGARQGLVTLALPAPVERVDAAPEIFAQALPDTFTAEFSDQITALPTDLTAVLAQITLPLDRILRLQAGEVLALVGASLDRIHLQGIDGVALAVGKLGQLRGMRAMRLQDTEIQISQNTAAPMARPTDILPSLGDQDGLAPALDLRKVG